jgi:hypothetical protein
LPPCTRLKRNSGSSIKAARAKSGEDDAPDVDQEQLDGAIKELKG